MAIVKWWFIYHMLFIGIGMPVSLHFCSFLRGCKKHILMVTGRGANKRNYNVTTILSYENTETDIDWWDDVHTCWSRFRKEVMDIELTMLILLVGHSHRSFFFLFWLSYAKGCVPMKKEDTSNFLCSTWCMCAHEVSGYSWCNIRFLLCSNFLTLAVPTMYTVLQDC